MFEPISDLPGGVVGFEAVDVVSGSDYTNVLVPAMRASAGDGIRLLLVLGDRFTGYGPEAMGEDAGLFFQGGPWKRIALVSDLGWVAHLSTLFGWMVPGKFKRFSIAERDAAIDWVAGDR